MGDQLVLGSQFLAADATFEERLLRALHALVAPWLKVHILYVDEVRVLPAHHLLADGAGECDRVVLHAATVKMSAVKVVVVEILPAVVAGDGDFAVARAPLTVPFQHRRVHYPHVFLQRLRGLEIGRAHLAVQSLRLDGVCVDGL